MTKNGTEVPRHVPDEGRTEALRRTRWQRRRRPASAFHPGQISRRKRQVIEKASRLFAPGIKNVTL